MSRAKLYRIDFEPLGLRGECPSDKSLLECVRQTNIGINSVCGGQGTCQTCRVQILSGAVSEPNSSEKEAFSAQQLEAGWRLACQVYPTTDCRVSIPPESMNTPQRTQLEGLEVVVQPKPPVLAYQVKLPTLDTYDTRVDVDRLLQILKQKYGVHCRTIDTEVLHDLSSRLRSWRWKAQVSVRTDEMVAIGPWGSNHLGLAIDLGTTKIAGYLTELNKGQVLAAKAIMNPQIAYGDDVISRLAFALKSKNQSKQLQELAARAINQMAIDLCSMTGAETNEIVELVVVGNTAMHHLLLGLPVKSLAHTPFMPAISEALDVKARDIGLSVAPGAYVHVLPNIAGFVGADHVAMLLATEAEWNRGVVIAIDIGTNTEVSLIVNGKISSVSCASGPAFEGGHIKNGMRAAAGAIERVRVEGNKIQYQTINGAPPIGICGSGILDALAQLYSAGIIDKSGRMTGSHHRIRNHQGQTEFVLVSEEERQGQPAIVITQQDIRELQLAKAAIRTGIQILLEANNCSEKEIDEVIIAGAFGSYIDVSSAVTVGMLPLLPLDHFKQVGNAAGMGAKLALISSTKRAEAQAIASRVHYIELATAPNFTETFMQANYIGQYRTAQ